MDNGTERAAELNDQVNAAANEENTALRSQAEPMESASATPDACSVKDGGTESSDASDTAYNSTEAPAGESAIDATADEAEAAGDPLDGGEVLAEDAYGVSVTEAQIAQAIAAATAAREREVGATSFETESFKSFITPKNNYTGYDRVSPEQKKNQNYLGTLSWTMLILAFPAAFAALVCLLISVAAKINLAPAIIGLSLVCLANAVIGFIIMRKSINGLKNLLTGIIGLFIFILMIIICLSAADDSFGGDIFDNDSIFDDGETDEEIALELEAIELKLGFDLPEYERAYLSEYEKEEIFTVYFDSEQTSKLLAEAEAHNAIFAEKMPTAYIGLLPENERALYDDYYLIYNEDTGRFNSLPPIGGTYSMVAITINVNSRGEATVWIYRYELNYIVGDNFT